MKKLLLAVSSTLLLALIVSGLWAARAVSRQQPAQVKEVSNLSLAPAMTMQSMVQQSELILTGQCLNTRTAWVDRRIVTLATVKVSEAIKGEPAPEVTVMVPGGVDANRRIPIAMQYPGAPSIQRDEEVFLFLRPTGVTPGSYGVVGFSQGKFSIVQNDQGEKMVSRDLTRVQLKSITGITRGNLRMSPLAEFKTKIREYTQR